MINSMEIVRRSLSIAMHSVKSKADIEAIEHSSAFYGRDAGEHALKLISIYGSPTYNGSGEVIGYEVNKGNAIEGAVNRIDMKG